MSPYDVTLKHLEPQLIASVRNIIPTYNRLDILYQQLFAALGPHAGKAGTTFAIWHDTGYKETDVDCEGGVLLKQRVPESGSMHVRELPEMTVASVMHHGPYSTLKQAYDAISHWVDENGYHGAGPMMEIYHKVSTPVSPDDPSNVTEIQWVVAKNN